MKSLPLIILLLSLAVPLLFKRSVNRKPACALMKRRVVAFLSAQQGFGLVNTDEEPGGMRFELPTVKKMDDPAECLNVGDAVVVTGRYQYKREIVGCEFQVEEVIPVASGRDEHERK